ncbi:MAG: HAD family hydrolase [Deltaproteobacteria bacterium]|nr:HAD family hydrolase [Deltaproteobacteria bacterium]
MHKELFQKYTRSLSPIPTDRQPAGRLETAVKCILFDVYGTLFISDSGDIGIARSKSKKQHEIQNLIEKYHVKATSESLLKSLYDCIETKHLLLRREGIDFPEIEIDVIWMEILNMQDRSSARQFALEFELIVNPVYPMPHLRDVLASLKKRQIPMGIISNAQFHTLYLFDWFLNGHPQHLGFNVELLFLSYQLKHAKPSAKLFNLAAEKLKQMGIPGSSVLFVGNDMRNDIMPAKKTGFHTALFAGDKRSLRLREDDPQCKNAVPDLVITDLSQLLKHIKP